MPHPFESRVARLALWMSVPPVLFTLLLLWLGDYSVYLIALASLTFTVILWATHYRIHSLVANQLRTLTNLLDGLNRGDYTQRGKRGHDQGALAELVNQLNSLTDTLASQRLQVRQSELLLQKVVEQINVAIFTFDPEQQLSLMNPAARKLLGMSDDNTAFSEQAQLANQYAIAELLQANDQVIHRQFPGGSGRFQIVVDQFIARQQTHSLLFVTNVQLLLREEERKAWQNLIRVISHEINNSLAPIASISQTLSDLVTQPEQHDNMLEGLCVIKERADSLQGFIRSYHQLARLPAPNQSHADLTALLEGIVALYPHQKFDLKCSVSTLNVDATQLRQVLINLIKNAMEAQLDEQQPIEVVAKETAHEVVIDIDDQGPGIGNPDNLFTPFYTTKPQGSGIGLLLSRQVLEAHGGTLSLSNRSGGGCRARMALPR